MPDAVAVRFEGIGKRFPGVTALDDVAFDVQEGSCHALCGKSTLGKVLAGVHRPDAGRLTVFGRPVRFESPREALDAGVAMVHQELAYCPNLSVAEHLCLGRLPETGFLVRRGELRRRAQDMLQAIGVSLDVDRPAGSLTLGQRQLLQIAAAVGGGARVIVFDEPTSSLGDHETAQLYRLLQELRDRRV